MAGSKFEYVRKFELENDKCLRNTWMVVRIDGRGFNSFTSKHNFIKPNDRRGIELMNACAIECFKEFGDIVLGYGHSDEYSFVFKRSSTLFNRRASKIISCMVSLFSARYVMSWQQYMENAPLHSVPHFDARLVLYPSLKNLHDYFSWRQADCHINNLYNTCFWALVQQKGLTQKEAEERLRGTVSSDKNEILFGECGINYNNEPIMFRKGSIVFRKQQEEENSHTQPLKQQARRSKTSLSVEHIDIINDQFWKIHEQIFN